ncbi:hypothetical protein GCM10022200_23760 [Microbacterium awajiense]|uniref:HNH nuclease domain-containing protein n=1 Tax=Microbacterium awajiense TaxID=415214 RepID=A0ABP7ASM5_9MICO
MESLADTLDQVERMLGDSVSNTLHTNGLLGSSDVDLLSVVGRVAAISRLTEALLIEAVANVQQRAEDRPRDERITTALGCRTAKELVQRVTRSSSRTVGALMSGARAIACPVSITTGESLPARYPSMRDAVAAGAVGLDGLLAVAGALDDAACDAAARRAAESELADSARGEGADGGPASCADDLRLQAQVWAMYLDQDGAEPREAHAARKRALTVGTCRDGLVPVHGSLLPEVAGQLGLLFDSILNPKGDGPAHPEGVRFAEAGVDDPIPSQADLRSRAQKQHDALATILGVAATSGALPTIGGAAPTLVVQVSVEDLVAGRGHAHVPGASAPVSLSVARHIACTGAVQRVVTDDAGRIVAIHNLDRVFNAHQRKAITLRDGGCIIPGCHVSATWCEIHHVTEHAKGGQTCTDNGVLLCWHHHRTLDSSGWRIRMRGGVPEVRGPSWWDASITWRAVTNSPIRMRERLRSRRE